MHKVLSFIKREPGIAISFTMGIVVYLLLLHYSNLNQNDQIRLWLLVVFAPVSMLGMLSEFLNGWIVGIIVSALQGLTYVGGLFVVASCCTPISGHDGMKRTRWRNSTRNARRTIGADPDLIGRCCSAQSKNGTRIMDRKRCYSNRR